MTDPGDLRQKMGIAALIGCLWIFGLAGPLFILLPSTKSGALLWVELGAIYVVLGYGGVIAWRRGLRRPLIVRSLIPIGLFALSFGVLLTWKVIRHF